MGDPEARPRSCGYVIMAQARKLETYRDKYFTTIVYEYRGCKYEVTYSNGWQVCCTPAWVQHRDAQAKIDDELDNIKPKILEGSEGRRPMDLDEIWELMGWD